MDHEFSVQAMVRGYHIYQKIWDAAFDGELLHCKRQPGNPHDPSAIAVMKGSTISTIFVKRIPIVAKYKLNI